MEPTESTDIIPASLIMTCDNCGRQYVRAHDNNDPCHWCYGEDDIPAG